MNYQASIVPPSGTRDILLEHGFIHERDTLQSWICEHEDFSHFKQSWNDLPVDNYLSDSGKYRNRRYAVFQSIEGRLRKSPLEPHYQTLKYNHLHGGLHRDFSEIKPSETKSHILKNLMEWNLRLISTSEQESWKIQCHQFRVRATKKEVGKPSPEGIHQDGAVYVFIMLLDRYNIIGASNTIHNASGRILYETTLIRPGESILVNDKRHWHGVSDIHPKDKTIKDAYRDVLVMTFHNLD